ncbi:MAG: MFS transporter [Campylobacteraceae bacterium]|jgi:MFS family permease|nr:MFS transporter [Campylobacteraceae bacterium]
MLKTVFPVSIIIALRFLGLFIVLPMLSVYALELEGANEITVGAAVGIYAISQMIMQTPLGALSDKIGRKEILFFGTVIFITGSLLCCYASNIYILLLGRFIQGMGAVGAVGTALISDLTKEEERAKAMAFMGIIIAFSFAFSMTLGPVIGGAFGVDKLFLLTAVLAFLSLFLLIKIPNAKINFAKHEKSGYMKLLKDKNLYRMNITNFLQKAFMSAAFITIPVVMTQEFLWQKEELWRVYVPAVILGLLAMIPSVIIGEKMKKSREMLCVGIGFFALSYCLMFYAKNELIFIVGAAAFFVGFNIHEPLMQSLASKYAKVKERGATLGVFNVFGYLGTFLGGVIGGIFLKHDANLFWILFFVCALWLILILTLKNPALFKIIYIPLSRAKPERLNGLKGVVEQYAAHDTLVVKIDTSILDKSAVEKIMQD